MNQLRRCCPVDDTLAMKTSLQRFLRYLLYGAGRVGYCPADRLQGSGFLVGIAR
jgi:hypothetical protein